MYHYKEKRELYYNNLFTSQSVKYHRIEPPLFQYHYVPSLSIKSKL